MKKKLLISLFFIIGLHAFSQPSVKLIAFEQDNLPGTKPAGVKDENGNPIKKAAAAKNYFIFLSLKKLYSITPFQVVIKGRAFTIQSFEAISTPVEFSNNSLPRSKGKLTLVSKTPNRVLKLVPAEMNSRPPQNAKIEKLIQKNDVVLSYRWKNKTYFTTLKKIKELEAKVNE